MIFFRNEFLFFKGELYKMFDIFLVKEKYIRIYCYNMYRNSSCWLLITNYLFYN